MVKLVFQLTNILQCNDKNKNLKLVYPNLGNFYKKNRNWLVKHVIQLNFKTIYNTLYKVKNDEKIKNV